MASMIEKGDKFPSFKFTNRVAGDFVNVDLNKEIAGKKVILFGLPGAFTPTCSSKQLPGYESLFPKFQELGIDHIYCTSVNDPFVMNAWFDNQKVESVRSLPDGNADLCQALGMGCQKRNVNFGFRSWRYALLINDGRVLQVFAEPNQRDDADDDSYVASKPESVLKWLQDNPEWYFAS